MKDEIRRRIREAVTAIPPGYRSDDVIKETIRCVLFGFLKEQGLIPVQGKFDRIMVKGKTNCFFHEDQMIKKSETSY